MEPDLQSIDADDSDRNRAPTSERAAAADVLCDPPKPPRLELDEPLDRRALEREISRLEAKLSQAPGTDAAAFAAAVAQARAAGDPALMGRALCLLSRTQIISGQHAQALLTADEGVRAFAALDKNGAQRYAGFLAEVLRAAGSALLKLGRLTEALPKLEEAIRIAQAGVDDPCADEPNPTVISAVSALIRSSITLGVALFAIRETDTAIRLYYRAMAVADAHPEAYANFIDDVMLAHWNLTDALHERVKRLRAAGDLESAEQNVIAARTVLDAQAWRVVEPGAEPTGQAPGSGTLTAFGRAGYYAAAGQHLLITGKPVEAQAMFERLLTEIKRQPFVDDWAFADAQTGLAHAALARGSAQAALAHSSFALAALDRHDESNTRATVLRARAEAFRALGQFAEAYATLEAHHALRAGLEAAAAQNYAQHMTARLGLERARADAESHRRFAVMLETLGRIGQEITANLDADTVFRMLHRHVGALLAATTFTVWMLDDRGEHLVLSFGIEGDRPLQGPSIPLDHPHSFAARAVRERRETFVDASTPADELRRLSGGVRPMQAAIFAPLIVAERVLGVISTQSDASNAYTENDRLIFRTLGTYGAIALDNAAAYRKLAQTVVALQSTQTELASRTAEFERLSMTDPLTEVANRRHLHERAVVEIAELRRRDGRLAVAMFDIDHFKQVNDTYGHAVGDVVLQMVARIAKNWLRPADVIARVGGEEFALLLPGAGLAEAGAIAERIRASIAETAVPAGDSTISVTTSFGVASFAAPDDTLDHALNRADAALYEAKKEGRNRVHYGTR